jgi:hypothetical protein
MQQQQRISHEVCHRACRCGRASETNGQRAMTRAKVSALAFALYFPRPDRGGTVIRILQPGADSELGPSPTAT